MWMGDGQDAVEGEPWVIAFGWWGLGVSVSLGLAWWLFLSSLWGRCSPSINAKGRKGAQALFVKPSSFSHS